MSAVLDVRGLTNESQDISNDVYSQKRSPYGKIFFCFSIYLQLLSLSSIVLQGGYLW